jgi:hypothetical protein
MVLNAMPTVETRQLGLLDHGLEIAILRIFQNLGQIAALPILIIRIVRPRYPLERRQKAPGGLLDFFAMPRKSL